MPALALSDNGVIRSCVHRRPTRPLWRLCAIVEGGGQPDDLLALDGILGLQHGNAGQGVGAGGVGLRGVGFSGQGFDLGGLLLL